MSDPVIVAIITGTFGVVITILTARQGTRLKRVERKADTIRYQVQNDHSENLRDGMDRQHDENRSRLDEIHEEIKRVRVSVGRLWERSDEHHDAIHELELTQPRPYSRFAPPRTARHLREEET